MRHATSVVGVASLENHGIFACHGFVLVVGLAHHGAIILFALDMVYAESVLVDAIADFSRERKERAMFLGGGAHEAAAAM